jgi:class 3 adenylate cyclase
MRRYRGTKVKTIGDAYMAVFGAPRPDPDHPSLAIQAGLAMQEQLKAFRAGGDLKIETRIGIHTGTVIAAVVGEERMQFDIFGDNVNIASRFETGGTPGRVNCAHETYLLTRNRFFFEERGEIPLKHRAR